MKNIELRAVNENNWYDCCQLELTAEQNSYMESNAISILQSKYEKTLSVHAIYHIETIVGLVMYNTVKEELDSYWIYRIMIDKAHQGQGIGREAMKLALLKMKQLPNCSRITVGYHPSNTGAHKLYKSLQFVDNGDRFGKEMAVILDLNN